ncbi:Hypothetical predicted protein [Pelobates cultripes]|uniref:Uncharacterized protein n=1 Tax=Pelobates cultripes TaxID=61616 RepID=A0AAD1S6F6_PELCU|nr:Hypothetical predicted protein [Pelobates cultripes]
MKTLIIITAVLMSLSWITDGNEGFTSIKGSKPRRAFFSKRSFPPVYAENTQYNSLNSLCLSCPEECTDIITRNTYQQIGGMKREIQDIRSHICFVVCAAKCLKNWNNL